MKKLGIGVNVPVSTGTVINMGGPKYVVDDADGVHYEGSETYDYYSKKNGIGQNASGGFINRPMVSWIGEDGPEYVIPVGSAYRERGRSLLGQAASALGMNVTDGNGPADSGTPAEAGNSPFAEWMEKLRSFMPGPRMAMAGGGMNCQISIYASPGMDENRIADLVMQKLEDFGGRRDRGLYEDDAFFG